MVRCFSRRWWYRNATLLCRTLSGTTKRSACCVPARVLRRMSIVQLLQQPQDDVPGLCLLRHDWAPLEPLAVVPLSQCLERGDLAEPWAREQGDSCQAGEVVKCSHEAVNGGARRTRSQGDPGVIMVQVCRLFGEPRKVKWD